MRQETVIKLNPCPECGSIRIKLKSRVAYKTFRYECVRCGYSPKIAYSMEEARLRWNNEAEKSEKSRISDLDLINRLKAQGFDAEKD